MRSPRRYGIGALCCFAMVGAGSLDFLQLLNCMPRGGGGRDTHRPSDADRFEEAHARAASDRRDRTPGGWAPQSLTPELGSAFWCALEEVRAEALAEIAKARARYQAGKDVSFHELERAERTAVDAEERQDEIDRGFASAGLRRSGCDEPAIAALAACVDVKAERDGWLRPRPADGPACEPVRSAAAR